jgi:hypothetical protein
MQRAHFINLPFACFTYICSPWDRSAFSTSSGSGIGANSVAAPQHAAAASLRQDAEKQAAAAKKKALERWV